MSAEETYALCNYVNDVRQMRLDEITRYITQKNVMYFINCGFYRNLRLLLIKKHRTKLNHILLCHRPLFNRLPKYLKHPLL